MITEIDRERMRDACLTAKQSNDPNCKVGAVLHHKSSHWPLFGCNKISTLFGRHEVLHAEHNLFWGDSELTPDWNYYQFHDSEQAEVHVTKTPCLKCSQLMVKANIKRLVCPEPYKINPNTGKPSKWYQTQMEGLNHLRSNNVTVDFISITMINGVPHLTEDLENAQ